MSGLAERIHSVHTHVERLLHERDRLTATNASLEADLRDQQRNSDVLNARLEELERENEVLRAVRHTPVVEQGTGTKERIDDLVIEIDRCLALLTP